MSFILRPYVLLSATASGPGNTFDTDYRSYEGEQVRNFLVTKSAGDTIDIEVAITTGGTWATAANVSSAATSGVFNVAGSWAFIRAHKTGSNGVAIVQGMI
jgi:hypothetical protein